MNYTTIEMRARLVHRAGVKCKSGDSRPRTSVNSQALSDELSFTPSR